MQAFGTQFAVDIGGARHAPAGPREAGSEADTNGITGDREHDGDGPRHFFRRACHHRVGRKDEVRFFAHDFSGERVKVAAAFHPAHDHQIAAFDVTEIAQAFREGADQRVGGVEVGEDADAPDFFCGLGLRLRERRQCVGEQART